MSNIRIWFPGKLSPSVWTKKDIFLELRCAGSSSVLLPKKILSCYFLCSWVSDSWLEDSQFFVLCYYNEVTKERESWFETVSCY